MARPPSLDKHAMDRIVATTPTPATVSRRLSLPMDSINYERARTRERRSANRPRVGQERRGPTTVAVLSAAWSCLLFSTSSAGAVVPPALEASMRCSVAGSAVVCHVTAKASVQSHLTYARADVVSAPPFLKVLVGSADYSETRDKQQRLNLAFRAQGVGAGDVVVKVQGMVCADDGSSCPALARAVATRVKLGP